MSSRCMVYAGSRLCAVAGVCRLLLSAGLVLVSVSDWYLLAAEWLMAYYLVAAGLSPKAPLQRVRW